MVAYPQAQPVFVNPQSGDPLSAPAHAALHTQEQLEIEAIAAELGLNPSGISHPTVVARLEDIELSIVNQTFLDLFDTPNTYTGQSLRSVRVNAGETGLEFFTGAATTFLGLTDTPASYVGQGGQSVRVNVGETALEFFTPASGSASTVERDINQVAHGFSAGQWVYLNGSTFALAQANNIMSSEVVGVVSAVAGVDDFTLQFGGYISGLSGLVAGEVYFVSPTVAGTITSVAPSTVGQFVKPVFIADSTTAGYIFNMRGNIVQAAPTGIEVQDEGGSLTTAVTMFNFVGAGVTASEPVANEITITIPGGGGSGTALTRAVNQVGHGLAVGDWIRLSGTSYVDAQADSAVNAEVVGVVSAVAGVDDFTFTYSGLVTGLSGLTAGAGYFLSASTPAAITATAPVTVGNIVKPVLIADTTTSGYVFNMRGSEITDSTASDLSLAGQTAEDLAYFNGTNWVAAGERSKAGGFTKDLSDVVTTTVVTGVGFRPKFVQFMAAVPSSFTASQGWADDSGGKGCFYHDDAVNDDTVNNVSIFIALLTGVGTGRNGTSITMDADGFTVTWAKSGSPTGSADIGYLAYR